MAPSEFESFCADIQLNGLREPIWTFEQKIIDGRNRFNACTAVGVEPRYREWNGEGSLVSFVVSLNLKRRHLSESQRAMVAAKIANVDGRGRPQENTPIGGIISQTEAAEMLSVSERSVSRSSKVLKDGVVELAEMVELGQMPVSRAAQIAQLPKGKQKRIIKSGRNAQKRLLNKLKAKSIEHSIKHGSKCLGCDPEAEFTAESVSAFMQTLAAKAPPFASFFEDVIEELEVAKISDRTRTGYDVILSAIDRGLGEKTDLQRAANMSREEFSHTIAVMLDYGMIEAVQQGGKTEAARGAAKVIYRRCERLDQEVSELEYMAMEFD